MGKKKNSKPVLFISYYHEDHELAVALKKWLQKKLIDAVDIFISGDKVNSIKGAEDWWDKIRENLKNSIYVLVLMTRRSINERWIYFEAGGGYFFDNKSMPLLLNVSIEELKEPLNKIQSFDLTNEKDIAAMLDNITKKLGLNQKDSGKELRKKLLEIEQNITSREEIVTKNEFLVTNLPKMSKEDIKNILKNWLKFTSPLEVCRLHIYYKLDEQLGLPIGSSKKYLIETLIGTKYSIAEEGKETFSLKYDFGQHRKIKAFGKNYVTSWKDEW